MRAKINKISISIDEIEANQIRNVLLKGLDNQHVLTDSPELKGAIDLLELLSGAFHSSIPSIHRTRND